MTTFYKKVISSSAFSFKNRKKVFPESYHCSITNCNLWIRSTLSTYENRRKVNVKFSRKRIPSLSQRMERYTRLLLITLEVNKLVLKQAATGVPIRFNKRVHVPKQKSMIKYVFMVKVKK